MSTISTRIAAAVVASGIAVAIGLGVPNPGAASTPTAAAAAKVDTGDLLVIGGPAIRLPTAVVAG